MALTVPYCQKINKGPMRTLYKRRSWPCKSKHRDNTDAKMTSQRRARSTEPKTAKQVAKGGQHFRVWRTLLCEQGITFAVRSGPSWPAGRVASHQRTHVTARGLKSNMDRRLADCHCSARRTRPSPVRRATSSLHTLSLHAGYTPPHLRARWPQAARCMTSWESPSPRTRTQVRDGWA